MLETIASDEDLFGAERAQQAKQQQGWLADLKAGLLGGNLFRRFLQQHCSQGSQTSQICGHQTFSQAVSAIIRYSMPLYLSADISLLVHIGVLSGAGKTDMCWTLRVCLNQAEMSAVCYHQTIKQAEDQLCAIIKTGLTRLKLQLCAIIKHLHAVFMARTVQYHCIKYRVLLVENTSIVTG